jgi:hypothetical protein
MTAVIGEDGKGGTTRGGFLTYRFVTKLYWDFACKVKLTSWSEKLGWGVQVPVEDSSTKDPRQVHRGSRWVDRGTRVNLLELLAQRL